MEELKQVILEKLSQYWDNKEEIEKSLKNGVIGAEELLDWCRNEYEHKEYIQNDNDLDKMWDICNWYLDVLNGNLKAEWLLNIIKNY